MRIFLSTPGRSRLFGRELAKELEKLGHLVFLPERDARQTSRQYIFEDNKKGIERSDCIIGIEINGGKDICWEIGYAMGSKKPVILIRDHLFDDSIMVITGATFRCNYKEIETCLLKLNIN